MTIILWGRPSTGLVVQNHYKRNTFSLQKIMDFPGPLFKNPGTVLESLSRNAEKQDLQLWRCMQAMGMRGASVA